MPLAWVPDADHAEAERRRDAFRPALELDFYRADGDELPGTLDEVAFYVLPYMKGPARPGPGRGDAQAPGGADPHGRRRGSSCRWYRRE